MGYSDKTWNVAGSGEHRYDPDVVFTECALFDMLICISVIKKRQTPRVFLDMHSPKCSLCYMFCEYSQHVSQEA